MDKDLIKLKEILRNKTEEHIIESDNYSKNKSKFEYECKSDTRQNFAAQQKAKSAMDNSSTICASLLIAINSIKHQIELKENEISNIEKAENSKKEESDKRWKKWQLIFDVIGKPITILGGLIGLVSGIYTLYNSQTNERIQRAQQIEIQALRRDLINNYQTIKGFEIKQKEIYQKIGLKELKKK